MSDTKSDSPRLLRNQAYNYCYVQGSQTWYLPQRVHRQHRLRFVVSPININILRSEIVCAMGLFYTLFARKCVLCRVNVTLLLTPTWSHSLRNHRDAYVPVARGAVLWLMHRDLWSDSNADPDRGGYTQTEKGEDSGIDREKRPAGRDLPIKTMSIKRR